MNVACMRPDVVSHHITVPIRKMFPSCCAIHHINVGNLSRDPCYSKRLSRTFKSLISIVIVEPFSRGIEISRSLTKSWNWRYSILPPLSSWILCPNWLRRRHTNRATDALNLLMQPCRTWIILTCNGEDVFAHTHTLFDKLVSWPCRCMHCTPDTSYTLHQAWNRQD